jgi:hypothetical protein
VKRFHPPKKDFFLQRDFSQFCEDNNLLQDWTRHRRLIIPFLTRSNLFYASNQIRKKIIADLAQVQPPQSSPSQDFFSQEKTIIQEGYFWKQNLAGREIWPQKGSHWWHWYDDWTLLNCCRKKIRTNEKPLFLRKKIRKNEKNTLFLSWKKGSRREQNVDWHARSTFQPCLIILEFEYNDWLEISFVNCFLFASSDALFAIAKGKFFIRRWWESWVVTVANVDPFAKRRDFAELGLQNF